MKTITTEKITRWVDAKQQAKVESKAEAAGIADVWQHGLEHCDQSGSAEDVSLRAAVRAQQLVGCIPRVLDEPQRTKKVAAKESTLPDNGDLPSEQTAPEAATETTEPSSAPTAP